MITKLTIENFYSFADETVIDFSVGKQPTPSGYDLSIGDKRYTKAIAIMGANGAGKTQLLKPLAFLRWFIAHSFLSAKPEDKNPIEPHRFKVSEPTRFEIEFVLNDREYRYQVSLTRGEVISEAMFAKTSSQYSYIFKREKNETGYSFKQKGFPFNKAQAEKLRGNASLIAAAHSYDVKEARPFVEFFERIMTNVNRIGRRHFEHGHVVGAAESFIKYPSLLPRLSEVLCGFDLGISSIDIREVKGTDEQGTEVSFFLPFGKHSDEDGNSFELAFFDESSGTQSAFVLLEPILFALHHGGIAVIDELDNDLHPHLVPQLMEWFRLEHTNPHQAQLIFTCHAPQILNRLQKHQVYLVEKYNQRSEAWRLDEMTGLRADDNLYAKYMAGALGAVPDL
ncbi:AAA family ATPase [Pokkaliibacter sp. CJK22405]|uniref:AAA family ATPase n=1 Tax=Pokkaliibacter sp. CJK22405 TaxID=3384615 RepID=UPI0039854913